MIIYEWKQFISWLEKNIMQSDFHPKYIWKMILWVCTRAKILSSSKSSEKPFSYFSERVCLLSMSISGFIQLPEKSSTSFRMKKLAALHTFKLNKWRSSFAVFHELFFWDFSWALSSFSSHLELNASNISLTVKLAPFIISLSPSAVKKISQFRVQK